MKTNIYFIGLIVFYIATAYAPLELTRVIVQWESIGFSFPGGYRMWEELLLIWSGYILGFTLLSVLVLRRRCAKVKDRMD